MIDKKVIENKLQEQSLKEKMIEEAILIISSVEWLEKHIEKKLLEIDSVDEDNIDRLLLIRKQVLSLLAKLKSEERRMDMYMLKYRRILNEKKALLFSSGKEKQVYLRGVQPDQGRIKKGSKLSSSFKEGP